MDTVARGEMVESELASLIRRRDTHRRQTEGERLEEELYEPSVRAYRQTCEQGNLIREYLFNVEHIGRLSRTFDDLIAQHRLKADRAAAALSAHGIDAETLTENGHKESA